MRASLRFLAAAPLLSVCLLAGPVEAASIPRAADLAEGEAVAADRLDRRLLEKMLRAAGKGDAASVAHYEASLRQALREIQRESGRPRSPYRLARRIHGILQKNYLRRYDASADGVDAILDRGEYNCVSASLFYGIVARAFGFRAEVMEIPRHVYVRLEAGSRIIYIESTSRRGFDLRQHTGPASLRPSGGEYSDEGLGAGRGEARGQASGEPLRAVDLERAVAFVWYNAGRRDLEKDHPLRAAQRFQEAALLQPELASRSGVLASLLARAFRIEYEAGRFDSAYRIAGIDLEVFPGTTSGRDRLLAAASKRIVEACGAGDSAGAEAILDQTERQVVPADGDRLVRGTCPLIAAAAVRTGFWDRAARMAARYAAAEPDRIESARLARWVALRRLESAREEDRKACGNPLPEKDLAPSFGAPPTGAPPREGSVPGSYRESDSFGRPGRSDSSPASNP